MERPRVSRNASVVSGQDTRDSFQSRPNGSMDDTIEPALVPPLCLRQHSSSSMPAASLPELVEARRTASHTQIPSLLTTSPTTQLMRNSESSGPTGTTGYTSEVTPDTHSPSQSSSEPPIERDKPKSKVSR